MAAPYLLAELLSAQSRDQLRAKFLAILGSDPNVGVAGNANHGFPVADWLSNPAGMEMAWVNMVRSALYDLIASQTGRQIAGGFLAHATGDWLTFHASMFYSVERNPPTTTVFRLALTSAGSAPAYDFAIGDVWVLGRSGHRYVSTSAGHLEPGQTVALSFEAEFAGAAANDNPTIAAPTLVTAFAGVTASAALAPFTDVYHLGDGTGHLQFIAVGNDNPPPAGTYTFRVEVSGDPGTAVFSMSIDGGDFFNVGTLFPSGDLGVLSIFVSVVAGAGTPASFLAGDLYVTTAPGGAGYVQGNDQESDPSLADRCRGRWPSISLNHTSAVFVLWAKLAVPSISRVSVQADPLVPGRVQMVAADSHGGIDPVAVTALAAYINPRLGDILETISVAPARALAVVASGKAYVSAVGVGATQQAIVDAWIAYLATVPIGGVVLLAELEQLIMDAGAKDVQLLTLNGGAANVALERDQIPVAVDLLAELTWVYV